MTDLSPAAQAVTEDFLKNYPEVTRIEVITNNGREFVRYDCANVQVSLQDDGQTIKVFLKQEQISKEENELVQYHPKAYQENLRHDLLEVGSTRWEAQIDAKGPTDEEIMEMMPQQMRDGLDAAARALARFHQGSDLRSRSVHRIILNRHAVDHARAVLARWGHPTPHPVALSERLPGPGDCLDEGWAWFFNQRIGWRQAVLPVSPGYTHWLPAHALPTPEATVHD